MTKEEAKKYLMDISYQLGTMSIEHLSEKDGEKMREAINTLEQEPSEDAIKYFNTIYELSQTLGVSYDFINEKIKETVMALKPKFPAIIGADAEMFVDGKWVRGKIVDGYRFNDGIVTIEDANGKRYRCGSCRTELYREVKNDK